MNRTKTKSGFFLGLAVIVASLVIIGTAGCKEKTVPDQPVPPAPDQLYTCPMHPEVKEKKPGKCPVCGMNLVPMNKDAGGGGGAWTIGPKNKTSGNGGDGR